MLSDKILKKYTTVVDDYDLPDIGSVNFNYPTLTLSTPKPNHNPNHNPRYALAQISYRYNSFQVL